MISSRPNQLKAPWSTISGVASTTSPTSLNPAKSSRNPLHPWTAKNPQVLITEYIIPEVGSMMSIAWMGHTMMTLGGVERTEKDWARLLAVSGLRLAKVWRAKGVPVGVVEARLK